MKRREIIPYEESHGYENSLESPSFGNRIVAQLALVVIAACLIVYALGYLIASALGSSI